MLANIQAMNFTKKRGKRALLGFAVGAVAIGTIINSVQIVTISGEVSALAKEIEILKTRAEFNKNHTISLITTVGDEVRLNSFFDSVGQLISMARRDGEELVQIVQSIQTGILDPASLRELAEVVNSQMSPYGSSLDTAQFQELRTTMSKFRQQKQRWCTLEKEGNVRTPNLHRVFPGSP